MGRWWTRLSQEGDGRLGMAERVVPGGDSRCLRRREEAEPGPLLGEFDSKLRAEDLIRGLLGPVRAQLEELLASIDSDEQARLIELLDSVRDILQPSTGGAGQ